RRTRGSHSAVALPHPRRHPADRAPSAREQHSRAELRCAPSASLPAFPVQQWRTSELRAAAELRTALSRRLKQRPASLTIVRALGEKTAGWRRGEGCAQAEWDPLVLRAARRAANRASG